MTDSKVNTHISHTESQAHLKLLQLEPIVNVEVSEDWIDYNNHMTEYRYLYLFGIASDAVLSEAGIDSSYIESGKSYFTVESHLRHLDECTLRDSLSCVCRIMDYDAKRLHIFHQLYKNGSTLPIATAEQVLIHVDRVLGRSVAVKESILKKLGTIAASHQDHPPPEGVGYSISLRKS